MMADLVDDSSIRVLLFRHPEAVARIADRRFAGAATFYRVETEGGADVLVQGRPHDADPGDAVRLALHPRAEPVAYAAEAG